MLYAGLDVSRKRLDLELLAGDGERVVAGACPPEADGLRGLAERLEGLGQPIGAAIESMNGARFVHDRLEEHGWRVEIADAPKVKGIAPLAGKTDRIDAHVVAELCRRDLVPAIWLPDPAVRAARERARSRLHLVGQRTRLEARIHATLLAFGHPCPVSDLFGTAGRAHLERLHLPEPWAGNVAASLALIDALDEQTHQIERQPRHLGATHPYLALLTSIPGVAWILGSTIAAEIGDIGRFAAPAKLIGSTGLAPKVIRSGESDRRGPLTKNGPRHLRWASIEAAQHACRYPPYRDRSARTKERLGRSGGAKVAAITVARRLAEATWWMLTRDEPFAPPGATRALTA